MASKAAASPVASALQYVLMRTLALAFSFVLTLHIYLLLTLSLFGNPLKPLLFFLLASLFWKSLILVGVIVGIFVTRIALRHRSFEPLIILRLRPAIYVFGTVSIAVLLGAIVATTMRRVAIYELDPDRVETESFVGSLHKAGNEFLAYPHAAAIKDCVPYGWSYRRMEFYRLADRVAVNVLPRQWIAGWLADCKIDLSRSGRSG